MKRFGLLVLALLLVFPVVAAADPISLVTYYQAKDQDGNGLVDHMKKYGLNDVLNGQMDAGNVMGWGIANRTLDGPEYTHMAWVTYPSWTAWEATTGAFEAHFKELGEEGESSQQDLQDLIHGMDEMVISHSTFEYNADAPAAEFLSISVFKAQPGKRAEASAWMDGGNGIDAQLLADGVISGYGTFSQEYHTNSEWTHGGWQTFSGLDKNDAIGAAYEAASSEESRATRAEVMDRSGHSDELYWIIYGPGMDEEEEEEEEEGE